MFELLMSADMMVPDPDAMTEKLVDKLGIFKHERWRQAFDHHPYIAHFLRVHKSLAVSRPVSSLSGTWTSRTWAIRCFTTSLKA